MAVADTGAGPNLVSDMVVNVEKVDKRLKPGKARIMQSATTHRINSRGSAQLRFKMEGCNVIFSDEFQVTAGAKTPTILGVEFWMKYKATFDFRAREIRMLVEGQEVRVPFTVGDEDEPAASTPAYSVEDVVVAPHSVAKIKARVLRGETQPRSAHETWLISPPEAGARQGRKGREGPAALLTSCSRAQLLTRFLKNTLFGERNPQPVLLVHYIIHR